jgi:hypothetical protein
MALLAVEEVMALAAVPLGWRGVPGEAVENTTREAVVNRLGVGGVEFQHGGRRNTGTAQEVTRAELQRMYGKYNPSRLQDGSVERLLQESEGREQGLIVKLHEAYPGVTAERVEEDNSMGFSSSSSDSTSARG